MPRKNLWKLFSFCSGWIIIVGLHGTYRHVSAQRRKDKEQRQNQGTKKEQTVAEDDRSQGHNCAGVTGEHGGSKACSALPAAFILDIRFFSTVQQFNTSKEPKRVWNLFQCSTVSKQINEWMFLLAGLQLERVPMVGNPPGKSFHQSAHGIKQDWSQQLTTGTNKLAGSDSKYQIPWRSTRLGFLITSEGPWPQTFQGSRPGSSSTYPAGTGGASCWAELYSEQFCIKWYVDIKHGKLN